MVRGAAGADGPGWGALGGWFPRGGKLEFEEGGKARAHMRRSSKVRWRVWSTDGPAWAASVPAKVVNLRRGVPPGWPKLDCGVSGTICACPGCCCCCCCCCCCGCCCFCCCCGCCCCCCCCCCTSIDREWRAAGALAFALSWPRELVRRTATSLMPGAPASPDPRLSTCCRARSAHLSNPPSLESRPCRSSPSALPPAAKGGACPARCLLEVLWSDLTRVAMSLTDVDSSSSSCSIASRKTLFRRSFALGLGLGCAGSGGPGSLSSCSWSIASRYALDCLSNLRGLEGRSSGGVGWLSSCS